MFSGSDTHETAYCTHIDPSWGSIARVREWCGVRVFFCGDGGHPLGVMPRYENGLWLKNDLKDLPLKIKIIPQTKNNLSLTYSLHPLHYPLHSLHMSEDDEIVLDEFGFPVEKIVSPVSVPASVAPNANRIRGSCRKYEIDAVTKTYKARWKEENRDHYLAKNREYVARFRAKQKGSK